MPDRDLEGLASGQRGWPCAVVFGGREVYAADPKGLPSREGPSGMGLEGCIGAPQAAADRGGQESSSPRWVGPLPREEARWRPRPCIPGSGLDLQPTELPGATQVSHALPTARIPVCPAPHQAQ